jgi:chemotaxis protein methyltransferase CheR
MIWEELDCDKCSLEIVATDTDRDLLKRAEAGLYGESSLRELPGLWKDRYFERHEGRYRILNSVRTPIVWLEQDVFDERPEGNFDLVLCRYLVFTYCEHRLQAEILSTIAGLMTRGGALILGQMEELPPSEAFGPWIGALRIYRRLS